MADIRMSRKVKTNPYGPLNIVKVFRENDCYSPDPNKDEADSCGNEDIVIGREESHRVRVVDLQKYLSGPRPKLPKRLMVGKDFYLVD